MSRIMISCRALAVAGIVTIALAGAAKAQPVLETAQIHECLCQQKSISTLSKEMSAKQQALDAVRHRLAALDAQLNRDYPKVAVNDPASVQHYKALLARRDATYQRSIGPVYSDAAAASARYNAAVKRYNENCAGQKFDAELMAKARANLTCPAQ